jgi:hypothetical protein
MSHRITARRIAHVRVPVNVATHSKSPTIEFDKTLVQIVISEHENDMFVCVCVCVCVCVRVVPKLTILNIDQEDGNTMNCSLIKISFTIQLAKVSYSTR